MNISSISANNNDYSGYWIAKKNAQLIKESIENGTAPFLPDAFGKVKPLALINGNKGYVLEATELIPALIERKNKGYKSTYVGTNGTAEKARTRIAEGQTGLKYLFEKKELDSDGNKKYGSASIYFPEQTQDPDKFAKYCKSQTKQKFALKGQTLVINSSDEYMSKYVAACKSGAAITVSPAIVEEFKNKLLKICENQLQKPSERNPDIPKLNNFLRSSSIEASKIINELRPSIHKSVEKKDRELEFSR